MPIAIGTLEPSEPQDELFASTGATKPGGHPSRDPVPRWLRSAQASAGNGAYVEGQNFLGSTPAIGTGPFEALGFEHEPAVPEEVGAWRSAW